MKNVDKPTSRDMFKGLFEGNSNSGNVFYSVGGAVSGGCKLMWRSVILVECMIFFNFSNFEEHQISVTALSVDRSYIHTIIYIHT